MRRSRASIGSWPEGRASNVSSESSSRSSVWSARGKQSANARPHNTTLNAFRQCSKRSNGPTADSGDRRCGAPGGGLTRPGLGVTQSLRVNGAGMSSQDEAMTAAGTARLNEADEMFEKAKPAEPGDEVTAGTLSRQTRRGRKTPTATGLATSASALRGSVRVTGREFHVPPPVARVLDFTEPRWAGRPAHRPAPSRAVAAQAQARGRPSASCVGSAHQPVSVERMAWKPSYFSANAQPAPLGIAPGRSNIGRSTTAETLPRAP